VDFWPTPSASVAQDGESPRTWLARRELLKVTANNGNGAGMPLTIAAQIADGRDGYINPDWVELLQGFPVDHTKV
jgi:hypothetical protein